MKEQVLTIVMIASKQQKYQLAKHFMHICDEFIVQGRSGGNTLVSLARWFWQSFGWACVRTHQSSPECHMLGIVTANYVPTKHLIRAEYRLSIPEQSADNKYTLKKK